MFGNFSTDDIDKLTWFECEKYQVFFYNKRKEEIDILTKTIAIRNIESFRLARFGKQKDIEKYINGLTKRKETQQENDIEAQFKEAGFG